jgi:hypothetical protein
MEYITASRMVPMMAPMMDFCWALMTVSKMELVMASMTGFHLASMMVQTKVVKTVWSSAEMKADCLVLTKVV